MKSRIVFILILCCSYAMSCHSQSALNSLFSTYASNIKVNNPPYDNSSCLYATHYMTARQQGSQLILDFGFGWDEKDGYIQKDKLVIDLSTATFYTGSWSRMWGKWEHNGDKKILTISDDNGMDFTQTGAKNYNQGTKQNIISLIKFDFQTVPLANRVLAGILRLQESYKEKDPWLLPEPVEKPKTTTESQPQTRKNVRSTNKSTPKKSTSNNNRTPKTQKTKSGKYGQ